MSVGFRDKGSLSRFQMELGWRASIRGKEIEAGN